MKSRITIIIASLIITACSSTYYSALEKVGIHKRDLVVERVQAARESQTEASEQFQSALDRFRSVVSTRGGKLEEEYATLKEELEKSEARAREVRNRISAIEDVSDALFAEWKEELKQYESDRLRHLSEEKLEKTKARYAEMMAAMKRAENKLEPVLRPLRDNVLFLKHNLNAQAVGSLSNEVENISKNVDVLLRDLEIAVSEADRFIAGMQSRSGEVE